MNTENVKAILDGRKTQTRRVIKAPTQYTFTEIKGKRAFFKLTGKPPLIGPFGLDTKRHRALWVPYCGINCPYGQVGDKFYIKETHYRWGRWVKNGLTKTGKQAWTFKSDNRDVAYLDNPPQCLIETNQIRNTPGWFKRPSIFMPRWASRIDRVITGIRVERVQEISPPDILAEGYDPFGISAGVFWFMDLWDSINAKRGYSWGSSPWVWVIDWGKR